MSPPTNAPAAPTPPPATRPSPAASARVPRWWWALPLVLALLAASLTVDGDYVYDDRHAVLASPVVQGDVGVGEALRRDFWGHRLGNPSKVSWRPALPLLWRGLWALGEGAPLPLRALAVLGHLLATAALLALLRTLLPAAVALGAAALFAVHPVHAEALGGIVGQGDVFAGAFGFAALWLWVSRPEQGRAAALGVALVGVGALFKESAVLYGLAGVAWVLASAAPRRQKATVVGGVAAVIVAVAAMQWLAHGGHAEDATDNVVVALDPGQRVVTGLAILWRSLRVTLAPVDVAANHGYGSYSADVSGLLGAATLGLLALIVGLWAGARALLDGRKQLALWCALWFGPAVVQSHLLVVGPTEFAERLLYGSCAVACVAVVSAVHRAFADRAGVRRGVVVAVLVAASAWTWQAQRPWRSPRALWQHAVSVEPLAWRVHHNLGDALAKAGQSQEGLWHLMMGVWIKRRLPAPIDGRVVAALQARPPRERLLLTPGVLAKDDPCGLIEGLVQVAWGRDATPDNANRARAAFATRYPCARRSTQGSTP